jgi:hypothetical protein
MAALSARLIALAFPTTICALGRRFKTAPVAAAGPVPTVLRNGFGAAASQVVASPAVAQLANAEVESHPPIRAKRSDAARSPVAVRATTAFAAKEGPQSPHDKDRPCNAGLTALHNSMLDR